MFGKSRAKLSRSKSEALAGQCPEREDATKGSRLAAVQGTRFFPPEIPLAAVHEIPSPNRSPTKLGVGRAGKTVRPHCYNSSYKIFRMLSSSIYSLFYTLLNRCLLPLLRVFYGFLYSPY